MALERIKVYTDQLKAGMYVAELDRPWLESSFLFQGFHIRDEETLQQLKDEHDFVWIDTEKTPVDLVEEVEAEHAAVAVQRAPAETIDPKQHGHELKQGVSEVGGAREHARGYIEDTLDRLQKGTALESDQAQAVVEEISSSVQKNPDAAMWLTNLKKTSEDTAAHSMNVCALATSFARHLGFSAGKIESIGEGALLHDVGKIKTPREILDKPGPLSPDEMKVMQRHAEDGYNVMRLMKGISKDALTIIRNHHERVDGTGYPDRLKGNDIPEFVRVVAICDVYDELISDRAYHRGMTAHQALTVMQKSAGGQFGKELMSEFVRCIGIYPVGSVVKLSSGELGMVLSANPDARLKPIVMLLLDPDGRPYDDERLINLAQMARDGKSVFISETVDPTAYGIDTDAIIQRQMGM